MPSRLDRYEKGPKVTRRVAKNQGLYEDLKRYTNYVEVSNIESVIEKDNFSLDEITEQKHPRQRQHNFNELSKTEKLSPLLNIDEPKEHDINKILTEAKQMRSAPEDELELEEKRKLKKAEYNITNKVDLQKLEEIKEKRNQKSIEEQQEELKDLIDTIYSKGLKEEIDKRKKQREEEDLFSELMPVSTEETLIDENLSREIIAKEEKERQIQRIQEKEESKKIESSFFTKSTELNPSDLEEEEEDLFIEDKPLPVWIIVLIIVTILAIVGFAGFWIYKNML